MDYTPNFHLPQWSENDSVLHSDFNAAFSAVDTALHSRAQIAYGLYHGTDVRGEEHPNTLTFDFAPKLLILTGENQIFAIATATQDGTQPLLYVWNSVTNAGNRYTCPCFFEGNTVRWYYPDDGAVSSTSRQLNLSNKTYFYVAIG